MEDLKLCGTCGKVQEVESMVLIHDIYLCDSKECMVETIHNLYDSIKRLSIKKNIR